ncbi:MAG: ribonuclease D [Elusimicrobia bacterium]|nr:ribonuclease D [Elusimicrobiota bacterium]
MSETTARNPILVTAREHLEEIVPDLLRCSQLGIDMESNGFYAYRERVCLLQMSTPDQDFVIDPIAFSDLSSLGPLFADPRIEKIFHAGEYDVLCLKRDYGFRFANLFDTMIASRLLGIKELGLAAAIERHFGVKLSKKLQRADWGKRPLSEEQVRYAQMDTHFLIRLAEILRKCIEEKGRVEDAREAFGELTELEPVTKVFDPEGYWRMVGRHQLSGRQMACLKEIYIYREEQAQRLDRAHFRVMPDEVMLRVAEAIPHTHSELEKIKGMTPYLLQKYGSGLLRAVQRGLESTLILSPPPKTERPRKSAKEWKIFEELRQWRKSKAERENVEPVVIMSTETLHELARRASQRDPDPLAALSSLKRRRYGEELAALLCPSAAKRP